MLYTFALKEIDQYFNNNIDIQNATFINQLDIKANLKNYLTAKLFTNIHTYKYFIEIEKYYDNHSTNYMFWDLYDISLIFFNIKIKDDIISINEIPNLMNYNESNIFGHNFSVYYVQKFKNTLSTLDANKFILVKDILGDIHIIAKADSLNEYNIYLLYINGKYILLTNNKLPLILEKYSSITCLNDLKGE